MNPGRAGVVLVVSAFVVGLALSTLHARQGAERAVFRSLTTVLPVTDLDRSVEFYRTVLEFPLSDRLPLSTDVARLAQLAGLPAPDPSATRPPRSVTLNVGGHSLKLEQGPPASPRRDAARLVVHVANHGEYASRLQARGAAIEVQLTGLDRRPAAFTVNDPDGYQLYFTSGRR